MTEVAYVRALDVVWRRTAMAVLILVRGSRDVLRLSGSGSALWTALEEPQALPQLAAELAAAFNVASAQVEADLLPVLDELCARGVLVRNGRVDG